MRARANAVCFFFLSGKTIFRMYIYMRVIFQRRVYAKLIPVWYCGEQFVLSVAQGFNKRFVLFFVFNRKFHLKKIEDIHIRDIRLIPLSFILSTFYCTSIFLPYICACILFFTYEIRKDDRYGVCTIAGIDESLLRASSIQLIRSKHTTCKYHAIKRFSIFMAL